jgi:hypothetical protein
VRARAGRHERGEKREQFRAPAVPVVDPSTARRVDGHVSLLGKRSYPVEPNETSAPALVGAAFERVTDSGAIDLFSARREWTAFAPVQQAPWNWIRRHSDTARTTRIDGGASPVERISPARR